MKEVNSRNFSMVLQSRLFNLKPEITNGLSLKESHSDVVWRQHERCIPRQPLLTSRAFCGLARLPGHVVSTGWALSSAWESSCTPPKPPQYPREKFV